MLKKIGLIAAATVYAGAATAQSTPDGFYVGGNVQVEHLSSGGDSDTFGIADITIGYSAAGNIPIGFELDMYTIQSDGSTLDPSFTGSVYYDSSIGRFSIGLPRAALDDYVAAPSFGNNKVYGLNLSLAFGSGTDFFLKLDASDFGYGLRFDGTAGGVNYGISFHDLGDAVGHTITAGASYDFGEYYTAAVGFEFLDANTTETGFVGSLTADYGKYGGMIAVANPVFVLFGDELAIAIEAFYALQDFEVTAGYTSFGGSDSIYTVSAEYTFMQNGYVGASLMGSDDFNDEIYTIYAGWNLNYGG